MIAVDVNDIAEVHAAGIKVLNENLGPDAARVFLNLSFGGSGDWTKEKYTIPDLTEEEMDAYVERVKADTEARS